jgi:hypothetical protein
MRLSVDEATESATTRPIVRDGPHLLAFELGLLPGDKRLEGKRRAALGQRETLAAMSESRARREGGKNLLLQVVLEDAAFSFFNVHLRDASQCRNNSRREGRTCMRGMDRAKRA